MYWFGTFEEDDPVDNRWTFDLHPSEEMLEEYCFSRLLEPTQATVEEHLLVCATCQETLQNLDEYILLMKAATREHNITPLSGSRTPAGRAWEGVRTAVIRVGFAWNTMWAIGLGLACATALLSWRSGPAQLAAFRDGAEVTTTHAPAGQPLELAVDLTDLPRSNAYRLEMVSAEGRRVWDSVAQASSGTLFARAPKDLKPGVYWVRLYSGPGELLREFGLRLE